MARLRQSSVVLLVLALGWSALGCGSSVARVGPKPRAGGQVVVLLHGYGAPGDDLVGLAEELSRARPEVTYLMPAGPHGVTGGGRSWIPSITAPSREELANRVEAEVQASIAGVWKVIDDARRRGVECKDITVGGFSQGARIATQLALTAPAECPLGGVVVMSGGGLKELPLPAASGKPKMRVLVTHGRQDGVLAIGDGESTAQHFAAGGHEVRAVWFDGRHEIPTAVRAAIPKFLAGEKVGEAVE